MRWLQFTAVWFVGVSVLGLGGVAQSTSKGDPSDDFSFGYQGTRGTYGRVSLMSVRAVERVWMQRWRADRALEPAQAHRLARHLVRLCRQYRFDPALVLSLIDVESGFDPRAVSPKGARGLLQIKPSTARGIAARLRLGAPIGAELERRLLDPEFNLSVGVAYLADLRREFRDHSPYFHVAAYNVGPTRMRELMRRRDWRPESTLRYFERVRAGVHRFRTAAVGL